VLTYGLPSTPWHCGLLVDLLKQWNHFVRSVFFFSVCLVAAQLWPNSASKNWCDTWLVGRAFDNGIKGIMDRMRCNHALWLFFFFLIMENLLNKYPSQYFCIFILKFFFPNLYFSFFPGTQKQNVRRIVVALFHATMETDPFMHQKAAKAQP